MSWARDMEALAEAYEARRRKPYLLRVRTRFVNEYRMVWGNGVTDAAPHWLPLGVTATPPEGAE